MPKFLVKMTRTVIRYAEIEVEADNDGDAENFAIEEASENADIWSYRFPPGDPGWMIYGVEEVP